MEDTSSDSSYRSSVSRSKGTASQVTEASRTGSYGPTPTGSSCVSGARESGGDVFLQETGMDWACLLYTSPSPRD